MTENEALESALKKIIAQEKSNWGYIENFDVDENWAVRTAIEEVQQYRAIGTPEECRDLKDRLVAKKVSLRHVRKFDGFDDGKCPTCGELVSRDFGGTDIFCSECGQKLDWSGEE